MLGFIVFLTVTVAFTAALALWTRRWIDQDFIEEIEDFLDEQD